MSTPDDGRPEGAGWAASMADLLASDGEQALKLRDQLAGVDQNCLVDGLGEILASESSLIREKIKAAWLLKDLCDGRAVPSLLAAFFGEPQSNELRAYILDTLERLAFAGRLPALDLRAIGRSVVDDLETKKFLALLASVGTGDAVQLLVEHAGDPRFRTEILAEVGPRPDPWVDKFLTQLAVTSPDDVQVRSAQSDRDYVRLQQRLRHSEDRHEIGSEVLGVLWLHGDVSLIERLAEEDRLDAGAIDTLLGFSDENLSKNQQRLLTRAKSAAAVRNRKTSG
jgi:hypothetical protein